ncbi:unnamed protein product [Didymodactylos carnosus]|uniref:Phage tail collar domain-containing protein n=1 Tax=Didymodactylos carnosus TaxID=1234261 RepID=A0A814K0W6_9BILA|nr:unnamed protein product [Didymodactylos carnosus]CAF3815190.1 unnamed protein product [Didymodactylos carnosus]
MSTATQITLNADLYNQVWSSSDLNPDRLTSELSKLFRYNDTQTKLHNYTDTYFNLDREHLTTSSASSSGQGSLTGSVGIFSLGASGGGSSSSANSLLDNLKQSTKDIYSLTDIKRLLTQQQSEFEWKGEKFIAKSFNVYKLIDLSDYLQVAMISKQLTADKTNGAIVREISVLNKPIVSTDANKPSTFPTGTVLIFTGVSLPAVPWLLCNGTAISRIEYQRLFSVIDTSYGAGDGSSTFNLPDFRGRIPMGVDKSSKTTPNATTLGRIGGQATQILTVEQLPSHVHENGTFYAETAGDHSHSYQDPKHDHGGQTGEGPSNSGGFGMNPKGGSGNDVEKHRHSISLAYTGITINPAGSHTHKVAGQSGSTGNGQSFSLLQPYQTVNYIIYSG